MPPFPTNIQELAAALKDIKSRGATPEQMRNFSDQYLARQKIISGSSQPSGFSATAKALIAPQVKQLEALPPEQRPAAVKQMGEQGQQMLQEAENKKADASFMQQTKQEVGQTAQTFSQAGEDIQAGHIGQAALGGLKGVFKGVGTAATAVTEGASDVTKRMAAKLGIFLSGTDLTDEQKQKVYTDTVNSPDFQKSVKNDADLIKTIATFLIPVGAVGAAAKGATTAAKIGKGALAGLGGTTAATALSEGRMPTWGEAAAGTALGGALAPAFGQRAFSTGLAGAGIGAGVGSVVGGIAGGKEGAIKGAGTGALIGAGAGAGGSLIKSGAKLLAPADKLINSLIKPLLKDFSYGKNPGRAVAEEGITATSIEELGGKIAKRRQEIGQEIGSKLKQNKTRVSISAAVQPLDEALAVANKTPRTNAALIERLKNAREDILGITTDATGKTTTTRQLDDIALIDALEVKKMVGDITKFTGNASDDQIVNAALKRVYGNIKGAINKAAPDVVPLNEKYADLTSAEIAAKYRDKIEARQDLTSFGTKTAGVAGALTAAIATGDGLSLKTAAAGLGAAGLAAALGSTAVKTNLAKLLAGKSSQEINVLFKDVPEIWRAIKKVLPQALKSTKGSVTTAPLNKLGEKMGIVGKSKGATPAKLEQLEKSLSQKYKGLRLITDESDDYIKLTSINVTKADRGKGIGAKVIHELQKYAQQKGKPIILTAEPEAGKKSALESFYKSHGFSRVGKNKNQSFPIHTHIWQSR